MSERECDAKFDSKFNFKISIAFACRLLFIRGVSFKSNIYDSLGEDYSRVKRDIFDGLRLMQDSSILRRFPSTILKYEFKKSSSFCRSCLSLSDGRITSNIHKGEFRTIVHNYTEKVS